MKPIEKDGHHLRLFTIGKARFLAYPECGARLLSWHQSMPSGASAELILWPEGSLDEPAKIGKVRGGNPVLFPFSARTFCEGDIGFWRTPQGNRLPMQPHGYARGGTFELLSVREDAFASRFVPSAACNEAYPFQYEFTVSYRFHEDGFEVDFELRNLDEVAIPWSAGHHFYFAMPADHREAYHYQIDAAQTYRHASDGSLSAFSGVPLSGDFSDPRLVDLIHCSLRSPVARFGPYADGKNVEIAFKNPGSPDPWNCFVTWTETARSPFYCVEPWMGPPNGPEHGRGVKLVAPGALGRFCVSVRLK